MDLIVFKSIINYKPLRLVLTRGFGGTPKFVEQITQ